MDAKKEGGEQKFVVIPADFAAFLQANTKHQTADEGAEQFVDARVVAQYAKHVIRGDFLFLFESHITGAVVLMIGCH